MPIVSYRGVVNRGIMFIESMTQSAERGRAVTYGFHPDTLPNYPGDGSTLCLSRCRCHWRIVFPRGSGGSYYHAYWRLVYGGRGDHKTCQTCRDYAAEYNPYTVVRF